MSYSVPVLLLDQTSLPSRRSSQLGSADLDPSLDPDPRDMEFGSLYVDQGSGYPSRIASDLDLRRRDLDPERVKVSVVRSPEPRPAYLGLVSPGFTDLSAVPRQGSGRSGPADHSVPQYGHAYEDWNWPLIRRVVTGLTVAAVVALVSAVIALIVIHSQICYPRFHWWQGVTVYRADPGTFSDKDEDGRGDFMGMKERLEYVKEFGAGVIMLETVFDCLKEEDECLITDHNRIKPSYGDLETLLELTTEAHRQGLHVLATVPAGYTSRQHAWYQASRQQAKTSDNKFTDYYVWSDDADPELPSAFDQVRSQFYLYHDTPARPLLNYNNSYMANGVSAGTSAEFNTNLSYTAQKEISLAHDAALQENNILKAQLQNILTSKGKIDTVNQYLSSLAEEKTDHFVHQKKLLSLQQQRRKLQNGIRKKRERCNEMIRSMKTDELELEEFNRRIEETKILISSTVDQIDYFG